MHTAQPKICLVEDNPVYQTLILKQLESISQDIQVFSKGENFLSELSGLTIQPDLVILDYHLEGVIKAFNPDLGGETWLKWAQLYSLYQVNQISFDELVAQYEPFYKERGYQDFMEQQRDWRRGMHLDEEMLAGLRGLALLAEGSAAESQWVKYRSLVGLRQVTPEIIRSRQIRLIENGPSDTSIGPYDYSPAVLEKIRARLRTGKQPAS